MDLLTHRIMIEYKFTRRNKKSKNEPVCVALKSFIDTLTNGEIESLVEFNEEEKDRLERVKDSKRNGNRKYRTGFLKVEIDK